MKILFLVYHGFSEASGISKKIHCQVKGLRENGHEVHLCYYDFADNGHRCRYVDGMVIKDYLRLSKIQQIGAYSKVDRDPRGRTITVAYLAIVDAPVAVTGQDDAAKAEWWPLSDLPHLAFDHYDIMQDAIECYNSFPEQKG